MKQPKVADKAPNAAADLPMDPAEDQWLTPVARAVREWHRNMPCRLRNVLVAQLQKAAVCCMDRPITVGSLFSGTDLVMKILACISDFWKSEFQLSVQFVERFQCEMQSDKQAFLQNESFLQIMVEIPNKSTPEMQVAEARQLKAEFKDRGDPIPDAIKKAINKVITGASDSTEGFGA